jgi:hypothetical protein
VSVGRHIELCRKGITRSNEGGFATEVFLSDLSGNSEFVKCLISDHSNQFQPDNMSYVIGAVIHMEFIIKTLFSLGFNIFTDLNKRIAKMEGWTAKYTENNIYSDDLEFNYVCNSCSPDYTLGVINAEMTIKETDL